MIHFASLSFIPGEIKVEDFINGTVFVSEKLKKINEIEKINNPHKFYDSKNIIKYPGLISQKNKNDDQLFILSLIAETLSEKGINVTICKKNQSETNLDGASLQYLFNGFTEKKKYEIKFNLEKEKNDILLQKGNELNTFIEEWKSKISNKLKIEKSEIFLLNPKDENGLNLDLVINEGYIEYNKLKDFKEINKIQEKPLIEGCQLSTDIFETKQNNQDGGWGINETRGGEKYIPPIGWYGYGLKVFGKYDNGNNIWLDLKA